MESTTTQLTGTDARQRLLSEIPIPERAIELAGISTTLLEGGTGAPVVLLHGPGAFAGHWMRVIPDLVATHRVVAPDLPGHGSSVVADGVLDADRALAWLAELIDRTCPEPPTLVGHTAGGAMAARFACEHGDRIERLVLVDSLGLTDFDPAPAFGQALHEFVVEPSTATHDALWGYCAANLDDLRERMGETWEPFRAYNVDRARTPSVSAALDALLEAFLPAIPPEELARISTPTTLIWGRADLATPLRVAEAASRRFGWELQVIEDCADDPAIEQPRAFIAALRASFNQEETR